MSARAQAIFDELTILRCQRGDRAAWDALVKRWERPLFYYIRRFGPREPEAWDILQQTWLAAFKGLPRLRETRGFAVWLHRIARNLAISHRRGQKQTEPIDPVGPALNDAEASDPADEAVGFEDAQQVHAALDRISVPRREVLALHFLAELSLEQIAEVIDAPLGTIKSRLHYAKQALRAALERGAAGGEGGAP